MVLRIIHTVTGSFRNHTSSLHHCAAYSSKHSYSRPSGRGMRMLFFVKPKSANIAGLQLADLLANPLRKGVLLEKGKVQGPLAPFAERISEVVKDKFNRHLYNGRVEGYGKVLFPK